MASCSKKGPLSTHFSSQRAAALAGLAALGLAALASSAQAQGDLFAASSSATGANSGNSITKFAAGAAPGGTGTVVETGLNSPSFLAFGPLPSAPVPEASTTVSLGLLLVLGLGGAVMAARKKRAA